MALATCVLQSRRRAACSPGAAIEERAHVAAFLYRVELGEPASSAATLSRTMSLPVAYRIFSGRRCLIRPCSTPLRLGN